METLIRKTGKTCRSCTGTYSRPCNGDIIEYFNIYSQRLGELVVGGPNRHQTWIRSEFYCEKCGLVFRPTLSNGLKHIEPEKASRVMNNSYEMDLGRDVSWHELLPVVEEGKESHLDSLREGQQLIEFHKDPKYSRFEESLQGKPEFYLIMKKIHKPVLLDKRAEEQKRRKEKIDQVSVKGKKMWDNNKCKAAQEYVAKHLPEGKFNEKGILSFHLLGSIKIEEVKVPRNAVPARLIKILDNELNIHEYWVPADAVKPLDKK